MKSILSVLTRLSKGTAPLLVIMVGPNGAGKSTFFRKYLSGLSLPFVNADQIGASLVQMGAPAGEPTERLAAQMAEAQRAELINARRSFITETVFSDPVGAKVQVLREAQQGGFRIVLIFVCVESADLSVLRVKTRILAGGHAVPPDRIKGRYERMRANAKVALTFVDVGILVDNSSIDCPLRPVALTAQGTVLQRFEPLPWWAEEVLPNS